MPKQSLLDNVSPQVISATAAKDFRGNGALVAWGQQVKQHFTVIDRDLLTPPGSPDANSFYLLPASGTLTGAWAAFTHNSLAVYQDGAWTEIAPDEGWLVDILDEDETVRWNGTAWAFAYASLRAAATFPDATAIPAVQPAGRYAMPNDGGAINGVTGLREGEGFFLQAGSATGQLADSVDVSGTAGAFAFDLAGDTAKPIAANDKNLYYVQVIGGVLKVSGAGGGALTPNQTPSSALVVASGAITLTRFSHSIDGEGDAADNLDTINFGSVPNGGIFVLAPVSASRAITIRHGVGNYSSARDQDLVLDDPNKPYIFRVADDGSYFTEISGAGAGSEHLAVITDFGYVPDSATDVVPALTLAAATGKPVYFPGHAESYHFATNYRPPAGSVVQLIGEHMDKVTFTGGNGIVMIYCNRTFGDENRISGAYVEGITFDGGHVRDPSEYPYNGSTQTSASQALNLRASKSEEKQNCVVTRCRFQNFNGLPYWLADWSGECEVSHCVQDRTKDGGILYCDNVKYLNNKVYFSADNGVSISRSNRSVVVDGNDIYFASGSGIFVGGVDLTGAGNATVSGASYAKGAEVTVTLSSATWTTSDEGINVTVRNGADVGLVQITSVDSASVATAIVKVAIPASMQNIATSDWSKGPDAGGAFVRLANNLTVGCRDQGVRYSQGGDGIVLSNNIDVYAGMHADSETWTEGDVGEGDTTISVDDDAGFSNGDWVFLAPDYTYEGYFTAQINGAPSANVITLATAAPEDYVRTRVYKASRNVTGMGLTAAGSFLDGAHKRYFENFTVSGNKIINPVAIGMRFGTSSGSARRGKVFNNSVTYTHTNHAVTNPVGISLQDNGDANMRTFGVEVAFNEIVLNGAGIGVEYEPLDDSIQSYCAIYGNRCLSVANDVVVTEQAGPSDITRIYKPWSFTSQLPVQTMMSAKLLDIQPDSATLEAFTGSDGVMSSGNYTFTSAAGGFVDDMIGAHVTFEGAGAGGADLETVVVGVPSSTQIQVLNPAGTTVGSGGSFTIHYGELTLTGSACSYTPPANGAVVNSVVSAAAVRTDSGVYKLRNGSNTGGIKYIRSTALRTPGERNWLQAPRGDADFREVPATGVFQMDGGPEPLNAVILTGAGSDLSLTASYQDIVMSTEEVDDNGCYDTGTGVYTARHGGLFLVLAQFRISGITAGNRVEWKLVQSNNGGGSYGDVTAQFERPGDDELMIYVNVAVKLVAGQKIKLQIRNISGSSGTVELGGTTHSRLSIHRIGA